MPRPSFLKLILLQAVLVLFYSGTQAQSNPGKLVYADEPGRIYIINADGTGETKLTEGLSIIDDDPVYSPDGSKIAFSRRISIRTDICIMNADGTNVVTVISGAGTPQTHNTNPSWSPDGTKIVFSSSRSGPGKFEIWMANADGSGLVRLTTNVQLTSDFFSSDSDPAWSPDGSKIAFASNREGPGLTDRELYVMNPDGSNPVKLTNNGLDDQMPTWSPDSQRIAFVISNGVGIHIINRDGTNLVPVITFSSWPAWSPDGTRLAFVQNDANNFNNGTVFITKTDGTEKVKVTNNPNGARSPSWAPTSSPPIPTFSISGTVNDTNGAPLSEATLTIFGVPTRVTQSDSTGAYSFTGLPTGTYKVDASKPGFGFIPPSITLTNITSNQTANFTAFVAFTISGTVSGGGGSGIPVTLSGSESRSMLTETGGAYAFNLLPAGGNYTVSINTPFFNVTPPSITFNNLAANQIANFTAVRATYTISGTVRRLGLPKQGITVRLRDGSGSAPPTTITDANGHYEFTNVIAGRPYSVEPFGANYLADSKGIAALDGNKILDFDLRSANNIGFSNPILTVVEGSSFHISVFRGGNAGDVGPITINYATVDGTAKAGVDYTAVSGTLDFSGGAFSRIITVPILNDQTTEGSEQFSIILSNPTGEVDLAAFNTAVVTIIDNQIRINTQSDSDRAIVVGVPIPVAEPFSLTTEWSFSADHRTRIGLFVEDLRIHQTFPTIVVEAMDVQQNRFVLPLEGIAFYSIFPFQQLIVRLPENLSTGELFVTVTVNGTVSNTARISIKP